MYDDNDDDDDHRTGQSSESLLYRMYTRTETYAIEVYIIYTSLCIYIYLLCDYVYIIKVYRTVHNIVPEPYDDHLAAGPRVHNISYKMYIVIARCRSICADTSVRMPLAISGRKIFIHFVRPFAVRRVQNASVIILCEKLLDIIIVRWLMRRSSDLYII